MRILLDRLYGSCAWLAAGFMILILLSILIQIAGGVFDFYIRGTDAYAGYFMAGASFLALADTLKRGEHIRVTLIIQRFSGMTRRLIELWCLGVSALLSGAFAFYAWKMVWWSYQYNDVSQAEDRLPLWIPELSMAVGVSVLLIAVLDELIQVASGRDVAIGEAGRTE